EAGWPLPPERWRASRRWWRATRLTWCARGLGLWTTSPVESTARAFTPTSTPTTSPGWVGEPTWRDTSQPNETYHRPATPVRVAERMRAEPTSTSPASAVVGSLLRTMPMRGSRMWRASTTPRAPVLNRHERLARRFLKTGNPTRGPLHRPALESDHANRAQARVYRPVLAASLEFWR